MIEPTIENDLPATGTSQPERNSITRLFWMLKLVALISIVLLSLYYWRTQAVQVVGLLVFSLIGLILVQVGQVLYHRGRQISAGLAAIAGIIAIFAAPAILLKHAEGYLVFAGMLAVTFAATLIFKAPIQRLAAVAAFLLFLLIASRADIFVELDALSLPGLRYFFSALAILLGLAAAWQLMRNVHVSNIRSRLTAAFVVVAVIPLIIAAGAASTIGSKATTDSAIELLTTVIDLKAAAVDSWMLDLKQQIAYAAAGESGDYNPAALLSETRQTERYQQLHESLQERLSGALNSSRNFREYLILDNEGSVILSTNKAHEGLNLEQEPFFINALKGPSTTPLEMVEALGGSVLLVSKPIVSNNQTLGIYTGIAELSVLSDLIQEGGYIGETGRVHLVASDFTPLSHLLAPEIERDKTSTLNRGSIDAILGKQDGAGTYMNAKGTFMIGAYRWLPELGAAIFAERSRSEVFSPTILTIAVNSAISLLLVIGAVVFGLLVSNSIGRPLEDLIKITQRAAKGNLTLEAPGSRRNDEIGVLARSFNQMTGQLHKLVENLEQHVDERTMELEARNEQLLIASQLSGAITSILDVEELIQQVVNLIQDRFNLYYVGLFIIDNLNQYAVLKAGTGEAGREMINRGHRIKIGEGMIGWSVLNSKARIAQQAVEDPVRLSIPFLPDTQSEAAIPLRSRGQVIGAITIQSDRPDAFDPASLATFQTVADQIAVAIDNARLFVEVQRSLETTRRAYGELSRKAWLERISARPLQVVCNEGGVSVGTLDGSLPITTPEATQHPGTSGNGAMHVPVKVRGTVIGYLHAQKRETADHWDDEEKEILDTLTDQLGVALESARLFEETLTRATQERLISHTANRVRETLDVETVLKTAILEMQAAMDLQEVEVHLLQNIEQENRQ